LPIRRPNLSRRSSPNVVVNKFAGIDVAAQHGQHHWQTESKQGRGLRRPRPPSRRRPAKLLAILAHNSDGRPHPDSDFTIGADKRAFGGNAADNIFGGQGPPRWRILGHGFKAVPVTAQPVKDVLAGRSLDH
jgi:hypothetical protein